MNILTKKVVVLFTIFFLFSASSGIALQSENLILNNRCEASRLSLCSCPLTAAAENHFAQFISEVSQLVGSLMGWFVVADTPVKVDARNVQGAKGVESSHLAIAEQLELFNDFFSMQKFPLLVQSIQPQSPPPEVFLLSI